MKTCICHDFSRRCPPVVCPLKLCHTVMLCVPFGETSSEAGHAPHTEPPGNVPCQSDQSPLAPSRTWKWFLCKSKQITCPALLSQRRLYYDEVGSHPGIRVLPGAQMSPARAVCFHLCDEAGESVVPGRNNLGSGLYFTTCRKGWAWQQSSDVAGKGNEGEGKRRRKSWEEAFTSWVSSWQVNSDPSQL